MTQKFSSFYRNGVLLLIGWTIAAGTLGCLPGSGDRGKQIKEGGDARAAELGAQEERGTSAETSDLDQTLGDLLAARCEHDIPQYTCDECRYQVGAVKADPSLFREGGPLDTLRVSERSLSSGLELDGEVELDASRAVALSPRAAGVVRAILVDLGSRVLSHQVVCELDCPEYSEAKAQYLRARAGLGLAQATWERESDLYQKRICPEKDLLEARAALQEATAEERSAIERLRSFGLTDADLRPLESAATDASDGRLPVRAPFAGTVLERNLSIGATVEPGERMLLIGDTSRMWILTNLHERELAKLIEREARGEIRAEVQVAAQPGRIFEGRFDRLHGTLDQVTRTAKARILVDNSQALLRAGMFARVRLLLDSEKPVLAVPDAAVLEDVGRSFVFVRVIPPYFVRRPVQTGANAAGWTAILGGLDGRETVVTQGAFLLKSDVLRSKMGAGCAD